MSTTFGGNLLLMGSVANLAMSEWAEARGVAIAYGRIREGRSAGDSGDLDLGNR